MPKQKIDRVKLSQALKAGKSQREIAQVFGVSEGAISKAKKELNLSVVKNVALENAHRIVDKNLDTVDQLQKINENANEILDLLMRYQRGDTEALQSLENQKSPTLCNLKDPREMAFKAMAEIRNQLKLQLEIFQTLYDMQAVQEFQQEVLAIIGEVEPDARDRIIRNLQEKRAMRTTVSLNQ